MTILKIVPDTNLWIAARWNPRSSSARILELADEGKVVLLWSADTRRELQKILGNVKAPPDFLAYVDELLAKSVDVGETERLDIIVADPDDNKFLACAKAGGADYIISSDEHLLSLKEFGDTEIVKPTMFLDRFTAR